MTPSIERTGGARPRILIVDDEPANRQLLEVMLGQEDYELMFAEDATVALAEVARARPDLILSDVMMPGMNGYELAARLQEEEGTRHIPVVMVTSLDDSNSRLHGLSAGAVGFIPKPVNRHELILRVRNLLRVVQD